MDKVKDVKYWYLRNHQIFSQMNEQEIKMLCIISRFKRARKNDLIFFDEVKRIYFLKKGIIKIILTHQDIADIIGATRQTVTSLINELERNNKINYSRSKIFIPNINELKAG